VRILHVDPEHGWGGGEVQVAALLRALAAHGHASTLAADAAGPLARAAGALGIPVHALRIRNHLDVRAGLALRRLVGGHDVVHFHTARAHALAPLCRTGGARLVVTRRMDYVPAGGPYARFLYNRAVDAVIAISEGVRAALVRAGVRADRIRVVPSGVDPAAFEASSASRTATRAAWGAGDAHVVVMLPGVLEPRKGHAVLLAAATRLASTAPDLCYVFCGAGDQADALRAAAAPLGDAVRFAGFQRDMAPCFAAADIVVLPSFKEGLGVAALEAMAARRAVLGSRVGGLAEAIVDGETGLLVPPGDAEALAAGILRLARDPALRARMGAAGHARVRARFTTAHMADGTLACYENRP
jgi:glycosyltransferase involved in cell wall biosynthesis